MRKAAFEIEDWYRRLTEKGNRLLVFADRPAENSPLPWRQWIENIDVLIRESASPPFRRGDRLRESRAAAGAPSVTFGAVFSYPSVEQARAAWEKVRQKLERMRDMAQAFGLAGDGSRPALLRLSDRFISDQASALLTAVRKSYPAVNDWSLTDLPDAAAAEIRRAAQASYQQAVRAGREAIRRHFLDMFSDGKQTVQRWQMVADWLPIATELHDWRELAHLLLRLDNPAAEDPVTAFASFVRRDRFEIDLRCVRLTIPDDLRDLRLRPAGKLIISDRSAYFRHLVTLQHMLEGANLEPHRIGNTNQHQNFI